jgi:hypothetical protein
MTRPLLLSISAGLALLMSAACQGVIDGASSDEPGNGAGGGLGPGGGSGLPGSGGSSGGNGNGSGGATGMIVVGSSGGTSGGSCTTGALPATIQAMLNNTCIACHGRPPALGVPESLTGYADLIARAASDPTKTNAELSLARLQDNAKPMPPAPLSRASAADIAALQSWVAAGMPGGNCPDGGTTSGGSDGGAPVESAPLVDPFSAAPVCTSKRTWTAGNRGSGQMNPGMACIACHSRGEGPGSSIAGTLYPTAHEPDLCDGVSGTTGAQVMIVGADGQQVTLTPNGAGNFDYRGAVALPYKAKVVFMGRERAMISAQNSGDCNSCHTQTGAMAAGTTMKAPGRILLP